MNRLESASTAREILKTQSKEMVGNNQKETKQLLATYDAVLKGDWNAVNTPGYYFQIFDILGVHRNEKDEVHNQLYELFCALDAINKGVYRKTKALS